MQDAQLHGRVRERECATAKGCNVTVMAISTGCMNAAGHSSVSLTPRYAQGAIADSTSVYFTGGTDFLFELVSLARCIASRWQMRMGYGHVNSEDARSLMSLGAFGSGIIYVQGGTSPDLSFVSNSFYGFTSFCNIFNQSARSRRSDRSSQTI